jgi:glycosyltransferase involved in cell wall biosynthesis
VQRALNRTTPELITAANADRADLYIAHNLGALPAAVIAAKHHGALAGFDAEDFHAGESTLATTGDDDQLFTIRVEKRFINQCDYVSASSPEISNLYASHYGIQTPLTLLNVFPLHQQPAHREERCSSSLRLYWFSQTIGANRGLDDVVQAMGRISDQNVELHLRGSWQAGYQEFLYKLASSNGVRKSVIIAHEPGLPDEMPRLAAQFDVGLSPEQLLPTNRNYCLPNKLFTYLLAGNAIVATETVAQSRLLDSIGAAARVYPPGDIDALSKILRDWHENRELLEKARRSSWRAGREKYNWDNEKIKFLNEIDSVLHH